MTGHTTSADAPTPWLHVAATATLLTVILAALLTAFAWPAARSSPHDIPIGVAGPTPVTDQIATALRQHQPGAFDLTHLPDTTAAEAAILDREIYGAIDVSTGTPQVIVASAASPVVAQTLRGVATGLATATAPADPPVRDIAALPPDDPRGAGLTAGSLPLVLGGLLAAVALTHRTRGTGRRLTGALTFAAAAGLTLTAILQFWLGSITGDYWTNAGAVALSLAATTLTVLGLGALFGTVGFGLGAATLMLLGNPLSGAASAPEMLPGWSGQLGQLLPPGATASLLRATAFFAGAGAARPLAVLSAWLLLGLALCATAGVRGRRHGADRLELDAAS